tara:strand:+ start:704 stop:1321 length:618 start_codon:yes stop_codon:yes gene_type:complete
MKNNLSFICSFLLLSLGSLKAQDSSDYVNEILKYQQEQNLEFADSAHSPLSEEDRKNFKELDFFTIDSSFRVVAKFIRVDGEKPFKMATTTDRKPLYIKYGEAHFSLNGEAQVLSIYRSLRLVKMEAYKDYLFLPFKDLSNGIESYGGGRFIDLSIPEGDSIIIDFNKSYNPYCAYNARYSCPIPPEENNLEVEIRAGVKNYGKH